MFDPVTGKAHPKQAPPPAPEPHHQQKITREKWFEIASVMILIVGGIGFLAWRNGHTPAEEPVDTVAEAAILLETRGFSPQPQDSLGGRAFNGYEKGLRDFTCFADLIGPKEGALETAVLWLEPKVVEPAPTEHAIQEAVNEVAHLARLLVPASEQAIENAIRTSEHTGGETRSFNKGVAGTSDGWKVTYVTYSNYSELGQPVLVLVLQTLAAGSDPSLGDFNRTLYRSIERGVTVRTAFQRLAGSHSSLAEDGKILFFA